MLALRGRSIGLLSGHPGASRFGFAAATALLHLSHHNHRRNEHCLYIRYRYAGASFMSNTRWSASDDAKLARLLKDGTINTNDSLAKEVIEQIRLKYFPIAQYKNFRPLLLKKCQKWRLNQSLSGARARCK